MIGYHCRLPVGEVIESIQFFPFIEMGFLVLTKWLSVSTECLRGGII